MEGKRKYDHKKYYQENKEKIRAYYKKWAQDNRERELQRKRDYYRRKHGSKKTYVVCNGLENEVKYFTSMRKMENYLHIGSLRIKELIKSNGMYNGYTISIKKEDV